MRFELTIRCRTKRSDGISFVEVLLSFRGVADSLGRQNFLVVDDLGFEEGPRTNEVEGEDVAS